MTKRLNISIPDDLAEKIEARRKELGSLSAIFQKAVSDVIRRKEEFEVRLNENGKESMDETIERLRLERVQCDQDYMEQGKLDGLKWAKAASYPDLVQAIQLVLNKKKVSHSWYTYPEHLTAIPGLGSYFERMLQGPLSFCEQMEDSPLHPISQNWFAGWAIGVEEFYRKVSPKLWKPVVGYETTKVKNLLSGEVWDAEWVVWTDGDSNGETPRDQGMSRTKAKKHALGYRLAGVVFDPWGFDDKQKIWWPVEIIE